MGPDSASSADALICTLGITCNVQLSGYGMVSSNAIIALEAGECGQAGVTAVLSGRLGSDRVGDGTEVVYDLGAPEFYQPGPFYRLCWANDPASLTSYASFVVELAQDGELQGPDAALLRCVVGLLCSLELTGYKLGSNSRLAILASGECGAETAVLATWAESGDQLQVSPNDVVSDAQHNYVFGTPVSRNVGNFYQVC